MNTCSLQYLFLLFLLLQGHHSNLGSHPVHTKNEKNRPFSSLSGTLYQNEVKCSAFDTQMIFHSHANKPHFHKTGCVLGLVLKVRVYELGTGLLPSMCSAHLHITELKKNWPRKSWKNRENATKSTLHKVMNNALIPVFEKIPPWPAKFPLHSHETVRPLYQPTQSKSNKKKYGIAKLGNIVIHSIAMLWKWAKKNCVLYLYDSNSWPFLRGLFWEGLIYGGKFASQNRLGLHLEGHLRLKIDWLAYSWKEIYVSNLQKVFTETRHADGDLSKTQPCKDFVNMAWRNQSQEWTTQPAIKCDTFWLQSFSTSNSWL